MPWLVGLVVFVILLSWKPFVIFLEVLIFSGIAYAIWRHHLTILGWFYALTPHPAAATIDRAIRNGESIDVDELKGALEYEPQGKAEQIVRSRQLAAATTRLQAHEGRLKRDKQALQAEATALAEERAHAARRYALGQAEEILLKATLAHEITAAQVQALREANGRG